MHTLFSIIPCKVIKPNLLCLKDAINQFTKAIQNREAKRLRVTTFAIAKFEERNLYGEQYDKSNI